MDLTPLTYLAPGHWRTVATPDWCNPRGGLWGGYPIGLFTRVLEAEPAATGEPLSITMTYAAQLPAGELDIRTRCLRQGRSIGVWALELSEAGRDEVAVQGMVTMAVRPDVPGFAFATMPDAPAPESLAAVTPPIGSLHPSVSLFERRPLDPLPPRPTGEPRTLSWIRSRQAPLDKAILGMMTDTSPPRALYAVDRITMSTTLSLTVYLHASAAELAEVGEDFVLVDYDGRVGTGGASDERSNYWRRDGKLLATSEQLAWYRTGTPSQQG